MLFVTRWLQALTISYLIDSFEIIVMPKEMYFFARLWQINSKVVFNFGILGLLNVQFSFKILMIRCQI